MRRALTVLLAVSTALVLGVGVAAAQTQTVVGDKYGGSLGDVKKIVVNNATKALTTKVFGIGKPCTQAKSLSVKVQNRRRRLLFSAEAGCYGATDWITGLYTSKATEVTCRKLGFARSAKTGAYTVKIPRRCIKSAPDKLRVEVDGMNWGSATGGHAGPTKALRRG
jgi:hypothetical protein